MAQSSLPIIDSVDIRAIDLNLLPVLDALLRHRSATRAARELDMSQSALSSALARLRTLLGDELFVRTGRGLRPTSRASALAEPVAEVLERVRDRIMPAAAFDPRVAEQEFRIAHTDVGAYVLWPRIVRAVRERAPGVRLGLRVVDPQTLADGLAEGQIDVAVGSFARLPDSLFQQRLFDRRHVAVMHRGHRLAAQALTLKAFAAAAQIVVRSGSGVQDHIDTVLARHRLKRTAMLEMPSYLMTPPLLAQGDFLAVMPGQLAEAFATEWPFVAVALPFAPPTSTVRMHWHRRLNDDAASRWLRECIVGELARDASD